MNKFIHPGSVLFIRPEPPREPFKFVLLEIHTKRSFRKLITLLIRPCTMKLRFYCQTALALLLTTHVLASEPDSLSPAGKADKTKTGWNVGALPVVGYNSDIGFQYGALANIYYYGNGSLYPKYYHSVYLEVSRTTKGGGINQVFYDSEKLLRGLRVTADVTYLTEKALDFYGFNGYRSVFNAAWKDDQDTSSYKTRMFYNHERKLLRIAASLQGNSGIRGLRWTAGLAMMKFRIGAVDAELLNKGLKAGKKLPDVPGLYEEYVNWGIITDKEKNGGLNNLIKLGLIYDTRDNEPNPMHGIWSEIILAMAPGMIGDGNYNFAKLSVTHRQYFTLKKDVLNLACRLGYQGTIWGTTPFYFQPYMINSFSMNTTIDGLGGANSLRGILRNRIVGDGIVFGNAELRWKFFRSRWKNQNWYFAWSAFADGGEVVQDIPVNTASIPGSVDQTQYFSSGKDTFHLSIGSGLHIAMNQNFIIAADYGHVTDKRDGSDGLYIALGFLF